jgi:hypothetical protein
VIPPRPLTIDLHMGIEATITDRTSCSTTVDVVTHKKIVRSSCSLGPNPASNEWRASFLLHTKCMYCIQPWEFVLITAESSAHCINDRYSMPFSSKRGNMQSGSYSDDTYVSGGGSLETLAMSRIYDMYSNVPSEYL